MADKESIVSEISDGILTLRINRPEKKNALTAEMYTALADCLRRAEDNGAVRAILLCGTDDCFTSGNDLADFLQSPPTSMESPVMQFILAVSRARKPVVAAVTGAAVGIGTTVLLHCDLVYAGAGARFQLPFVNLGLCPEAGSTFLFPRLMGHQRAAELMLLGEPCSAARACEIGIVNAVCSDGEVLAVARAAAQKLAARPAHLVRLIKELLKQEYAASLATAVAEEGEHFMTLLATPEVKEIIRAFLQRRKPDSSQ